MTTTRGRYAVFVVLASLLGVGGFAGGISLLSTRTVAAKSSSTMPTMQSLPAAGTYAIDPYHSFTYFSAWHHIVGRVRGRFDKVTGTITVAPDPMNCEADITIDASTVSTQIAKRDDDLRGPAFFDVKEHPTMTYHGRGIHRSARGGVWVMDGTLSIRGVSKVVPLTFVFQGKFPDTEPGEPERVSFHGMAETKRGDFGMTRDNLMELGPSPKGPDVEIEIDVEADANKPKA